MFGPYQVVRPLGEGGMGQVFLARSPGARLVAVKVIRPDFADAPGFRRRFRREAEAAAKVSGHYTAPVVDADPDGARPWLATSYVPAPSLGEVVARFGVLPEAGLRALGAGLAEALGAIHRVGVVHRDLKPGNILVAADGPRVIDFGVCRAVEGTQLTRTGRVVGTPGYMAPEQITSGREVAASGDVFALGCVLAFAATGTGPFHADGPATGVLYRIVHEPPNLDGVPEALRGLIARCLEKDTDARPSVPEILAALGPADPTALITPPLREDLARRQRDADELARPAVPPRTPGRRLFLGIAAATGVVLVGGTATALSRSSGTPGAAPSTPAPVWTAVAPEAMQSAAVAVTGGTVLWWNTSDAFGIDAATGAQRWRAPREVSGVKVPAWLNAFGGTLYGGGGIFDPSLRRTLLFGFGSGGRKIVERTAGAFQSLNRLHDVARGVALLEATVSGGGRLMLALDLASGRSLWSRPAKGTYYPDAVADDRRCYLQDGPTVYALDLRTGAELWSSGDMARTGRPAHLTLASGLLIVGTTRLVALDAATGRTRWEALNQPQELSRTAVAGGRIFVSDLQRRLWALNVRTGEPLWNIRPPIAPAPGALAQVPHEPAMSVTADVVVVPFLDEPGFLVVAASDGRTRWTYRPSGQDKTSWHTRIAGDTIYASSGKTLQAFRIAR